VTIGADAKLRLISGLAVESSGANLAAIRAAAIPLRKTSASRRTQNLHAHN
jgi:hypothetical protein